MTYYIVLFKWTEQGIRNVKDSPKRVEAAKKEAQRMGGKISVYFTLGEYDTVGILEMPDDETALQYLLKLGSLGNVRTTTLKAFPESEAGKMIAKIK
jgi:uncharacterized protein with GYD domain